MGSATKKNSEIQLLRFLFCSIIMIYHLEKSFEGSTYFISGYIGVEFFFLLSGFLMAMGVMKKNYSGSIPGETWRYVLKHAGALYVYFAMAIIIQIIVISILRGYSTKYVCTILLGGISNFSTLFTGLGFRSRELYVNAHWYLSAYVIVMFLVYPMLLKWKENALYIIFPILSVVIWEIMIINCGTLATDIDKKVWFFNSGIMRGWMEMMIGASLYILSERLKEIRFTGTARLFFTILKYSSLSAVIAYVFLGKKLMTDSAALINLAVVITLCFSDCTYRVRDNRFFDFLGKLSMPCFLFHGIVRAVSVELLGSNIRYRTVLLLLLICYIVSYLLMLLGDMIKKWIKSMSFAKRREE